MKTRALAVLSAAILVAGLSHCGSDEGVGPVDVRGKPSSAEPAAPANLTADRMGCHVRLAWEDRSNNETSVIVCTDHEDMSECGIHPSDTTTAIVDVVPNMSYRFQVQSCRNYNCSEFSNTVAMTTPDEIMPPPTDIHVEFLSPGKMRLSWQSGQDDVVAQTVDRISGEEGLRVESDTFFPHSLEPVFEDEFVEPGRTYTYTLMELSYTCGLSAWSEPFVVTTPIEQP
jgi:hypothetical protein